MFVVYKLENGEFIEIEKNLSHKDAFNLCLKLSSNGGFYIYERLN